MESVDCEDLYVLRCQTVSFPFLQSFLKSDFFCSHLKRTTGGVMHLTNIDPGVSDQIYKLFSMILCANTLGQVHRMSSGCFNQRH